MGKRILRETRELLGELLDEGRKIKISDSYYDEDEVKKFFVDAGGIQGLSVPKSHNIDDFFKKADPAEVNSSLSRVYGALARGGRDAADARKKLAAQAGSFSARDRFIFDFPNNSIQALGLLDDNGYLKGFGSSPNGVKAFSLTIDQIKGEPITGDAMQVALISSPDNGEVGKGEVLIALLSKEVLPREGKTGADLGDFSVKSFLGDVGAKLGASYLPSDIAKNLSDQMVKLDPKEAELATSALTAKEIPAFVQETSKTPGAYNAKDKIKQAVIKSVEKNPEVEVEKIKNRLVPKDSNSNSFINALNGVVKSTLGTTVTLGLVGDESSAKIISYTPEELAFDTITQSRLKIIPLDSDSLKKRNERLAKSIEGWVDEAFENAPRPPATKSPTEATGTMSETRILLSELFPSRRPSLVTELALYSRSGLITEGAKEKAIDAVQFLIGAAVEYGIDVPTLGAGAPLGSAAETVIDAAFAAESITSAVDAIDSVVSKAGKFKDIFNSAMAARTKIKGDLAGFYADVRRIVQEGLELLGKDAQAKVKELAEELGKIVEGMIEKVLDPIGKAIKFLIPDATIGAAAAEAVKALLAELAENCFDMVKGALGAAGKFAKFITDPDAVPNFLEDAIPKLVTFLQQGAKKLEDTSLLKAAVTGGGAGIILKELGPIGLNKLAGILGDKKGDIVGLARKITGTLIPIVFALLALMQVMLKGEYVSEDIEAKREKAKSAAGTAKETPKESKRLRGSVVSETHLLLRELGV
jgi:hypothetical protein